MAEWGGGVFLSANNGSSWTAVNNGLTSTVVYSLAISGTNIFAGTYYGGVWKSGIINISGTIYKSDNFTEIISGKVYLIAYDTANTAFAFKDSFQLNGSGNYSFSMVEQGQYLILAKPNSSAYPDAIPTYFGDTTFWQGSTVINLVSDTSAINIAVREISVLTGPGAQTALLQFNFSARLDKVWTGGNKFFGLG